MDMEQRWNISEGIQRGNSASATFTTTNRTLILIEGKIINKKVKDWKRQCNGY
jgi:hypothetical protein